MLDLSKRNYELRQLEGLKNKHLLANLTECVPNNYIEAKNKIDWYTWKIAMQNELNYLNKHNAWQIMNKPEKIK